MVSRLLTTVALFGLIAGCASAREGIGDALTLDKILQIKPGETSRAEVRKLFGMPDIVKSLDRGEEDYTYIQGRNDSQSWFLLSGYLLYGSNVGFSGNRILLLRFKGETLVRYIASDGTLTLKKGYGDDKVQIVPNEEEEEE